MRIPGAVKATKTCTGCLGGNPSEMEQLHVWFRLYQRVQGARRSNARWWIRYGIFNCKITRGSGPSECSSCRLAVHLTSLGTVSTNALAMRTPDRTHQSVPYKRNRMPRQIQQSIKIVRSTVLVTQQKKKVDTVQLTFST